MTILALLFAAALGTADVERLATYENAWQEPETAPGAAAHEARAREEFGGRAEDVARHFLAGKADGAKPAAHAFVLRALGDLDATLLLITALPAPPAGEAGPGRRPGEIAALLGPVLDLPDIGRAPEIAIALDRMVNAPSESSSVVQGASIALLGRLRSKEAADALIARLENPDPHIREMATQSLGWMGDRPPPDSQRAVLEALAACLATDEQPHVRFHAAEAIRHLGKPAGASQLAAVLDDERDAEVVDAIVAGLEGLGQPIVDPERARAIVARGYDAQRLEPLFDRWRRSVTHAEVIEAALVGSPVLRALALRSLVASPEAATDAATGEAPLPADRPVDDLGSDERERLLESAVEIVGFDVSLPTHDAAIQAAWALAGGNVEKLLERVDRIPDRERRYLASWSIYQSNPAAYDGHRRSRELLAAGWLALPFALGLLFAPPRRFALVGLLAVVGWGATTFLASGPLDLPPWPYPLSKLRFLVPAAAAVAAWMAVIAPSWRRLITFFGGPILFFAAYFWTRYQGFFPPDTLDDWIFVFEPAIGVVLTGPVAYLLSLAATFLGRHR